MHRLPELTAGILASAAFASGQRAGRIVGPGASRSFRRMQSTEKATKPETGPRFARPMGQVVNEVGGALSGLAVIGAAAWLVSSQFSTLTERLAKVETTLDTKLTGAVETMEAKLGTMDAKLAGAKEAVTKEVDAKLAGKEKEVDAKLAGMKELVDEKVGKKRAGW
jgi:hypothetical protein